MAALAAGDLDFFELIFLGFFLFFELIIGVVGVLQAQGANLIRYRAGQQVLPGRRLALDYAHNSHCLLVTFFGDRQHT